MTKTIALERTEYERRYLAIPLKFALGDLQIDDLTELLLAVQARDQCGYAIRLARSEIGEREAKAGERRNELGFGPFHENRIEGLDEGPVLPRRLPACLQKPSKEADSPLRIGDADECTGHERIKLDLIHATGSVQQTGYRAGDCAVWRVGVIGSGEDFPRRIPEQLRVHDVVRRCGDQLSNRSEAIESRGKLLLKALSQLRDKVAGAQVSGFQQLG